MCVYIRARVGEWKATLGELITFFFITACGAARHPQGEKKALNIHSFTVYFTTNKLLLKIVRLTFAFAV